MLLIILLGESFRTGGQRSRTIGEDGSYAGQMDACQSHIRFFEQLTDTPDVFISSYHTKFDEELLSVYEKYLIGSKLYDHVIGLDNLFHAAISENNLDKYDDVLYLRIDLFLKDHFSSIFKPSPMILFPTITWKRDCMCGVHPRVNDMMLYIPKKYYAFIQRIIIRHEAWSDLMDVLTYDDVDVMINTYHDSDSEKDQNPLYYIVNRHISNTHHSEGFIFDKHNFS